MSERFKKGAIDWIEANKTKLTKISDAIWEYAELGLLEYKSAKILSDDLEINGFKVVRGVAGIPTAFIATFGNGKPVIGFMGEFDALKGLSQKKTPFKEPIVVGEAGHGCGHNIHGTTALGGALAIKNILEVHGLEGTIKYFGCPAEESGSGKTWMVRDGLFDDVDVVLSHHPGSMNYGSLKSSLANNSIKFHFYGKTSHAAGSPEQGRSALDAVELMNVGVNFMREHIVQDARIHYVIEEGGGQPNVVPDYARSWYLIRAPERDQVDQIYNRILKIAEGATLMTETRLEVEFIKAVYNKLPNKTLSKLISDNMKFIGAPNYTSEELEFSKKIAEQISPESKRESLRKTKRPGYEDLMNTLLDWSFPDAWDEGEISHGSTDVSDVSWMAPTIEFTTTAWVLGTPGHHWMNVVQSGISSGHKSLIFASKVMATSAIDLITKPLLLKKAVDEFRERTKGKKYISPLPPNAKPPLDMWKND
ncbi:amidohydrolase [Candidatus Bathyarchaeota archaeon]|nr:amidohydrolase [Candidatus Bathyarchaeota archaeon]